jgi:tetratricopeptide (TPR) repeat protein
VTEHRSSEPPLGRRSALGHRTALGGAPLEPSWLQSYEDDALLERAWLRLEGSRSRSGASAGLTRVFGSALVRTLSAAALVLLGVGLGVALERARSGPASGLRPSAERLERRVAALPAERPAAQPPGQASHAEAVALRRGAARRAQPAPGPSVGPESSPPGSEPPMALRAEAPAAADWLTLAEQADAARAFAELERAPGVDAVLARGSAAELMTLAELARSTGREPRAIQAYRVVTDRYRDDESAPLAAMMLGSLLERAGDAAGAVSAYALYRSLSPAGDFAEDALARQFGLVASARDFEGARALLTRYEEEFPSGSHAGEMRGALDELARELARLEVERAVPSAPADAPPALPR